MTLPYPPELESGNTLHAPAGGPRTPIVLCSVVEHMVQPCTGGISVVGRELGIPAAAGEEDVLGAYRVAIADRLLERAPLATIETVRQLETVLRAELAHHDLADRETLDVIIKTIDGL